MSSKPMDETKLAEQIVGAVGVEVVRVCSDDRETFRFAIRSAALKLRLIVLSRAALKRLLLDPIRDIKVEYLQRDLRRAARQRAEFVYPRKSALVRLRNAVRPRLSAVR